MSDDKTKKGQQDRGRVAANEDYEVRYFAEKNDIAQDETVDLIHKVGNQRDDLEKAAEKVRAKH
ncbi:DUF3606 domain-containing protein [Terrihabitans rhizophilus]|uniref:DUF3606 domain-containing protein n=1 Tax=Terrihabitans rhizophilus TaxID=3092662 RepID=A0ABU4RPC1_9HYPH|nr:DUF3606 domain-containing protein [Terrihabitans sp. PJ23]MDX6806691.1 DUF3606 domain-containing protein [Terrihabitans sp. PJ23]